MPTDGGACLDQLGMSLQECLLQLQEAGILDPEHSLVPCGGELSLGIIDETSSCGRAAGLSVSLGSSY